MNYKRVFVPNSYVHLIVVAYNRKDIFISNIELLRNSLINAKQYFDFEIVAICVLPNHIHILLNPKDIKEYPKIITSIKYYFSRKYNVGVETPTLLSGLLQILSFVNIYFSNYCCIRRYLTLFLLICMANLAFA